MAARPEIAPDFHVLAESLPQIVWVHRSDGTLEFANQRALAYTGLSESDLDSPVPVTRLLHRQDRRRARHRWRTAQKETAGYALEARLRRGDGVYHWHLLRIHPMRDVQGAVARWLGTATDVHAAKEREDRSALLLALSTELARIADPHELLCTGMMRLRERLWANQTTLAELDHEERQAILLTQVGGDGSRIEISAVPIETLGLLALESRLARTTVMHDARHDTRAAQLRAGEFAPLGIGALICVPLLRGSLPVALLFVAAAEPRRWSDSEVELAERVADILWPAFEKARADRALAASEERLRLAQSVARVGAWEWDPETDHCFLSPECHELFGLEPAGPHRLTELLARIEPQDLASVQEALDACRSSGAREFEYRYRHPARGRRWIHSKAGAVWHGDRQRIFGIHLDVTERKHAEEALQEVNQRKDEFLAMLAHELRNPLAPIRNAAQIMRLYAKGNARLEWVRAVIERQSRHLTRLVDDLLDVSRIVRGQITLERSAVDLNDLVRHALETSRPLLRERKQDLTVALPREPVRLEADLTRLAQVVANLLINAAKYTPEGGHIWLEAQCAGKELTLRVRDTGVGIAPSLLPRVFDLFTQGARTLDRAQGGLGIGLTLVKRIVEMHGGGVEARSAGPDRGSEFIVRLPLLTDAPAAQPPPAGASDVEPGTHMRVLVVDDNADAADSIAMLLSLKGHEVLSVHAAHEALDAAQSFRPQLVLLDIGLPGMDGYEVARRLRLQQIERMRIVAITGYGQPSDRERSRAAGFDQHLVKPIDPDMLHALLGSVLAVGRGGDAQ
ncbi:MAG TPA: ATP-binding protein [Steroidobacteraceae bacterium]|nr:ATP-binding protein [Steroidobacteraceae bacterium]